MGLRLGVLMSVLLVPAAWAAEVEGELVWTDLRPLAFLPAGVVAEVDVVPGQRVAKGKRLMALDSRAFRYELQRAEAELARATPLRDEAEREQARTQELFDRTLLAEHELQQAKIAFATADADLNQATVALKLARLTLEQSQLRAPFDAWVVERPLNRGMVSSASQQPPVAVVIASAERMGVQVTIPAEQLADVEIGQRLSVQLAGESRSAQIESLELAPEDNGHYTLRASFALSKGERFWPGQPVRVVLP